MQQNEILQQWTEMNKGFMESLKQLGDINTAMMSKLTERQMAAASAYVEGMSKQMENLGDVKNPQDVVALQAKLAKEFGEKMMENARQTMDVLTQTRTDLAAWVEKGMEVAAQAAKKKA
ncbi:MAG: family phasin [Pseudomonadota bacterium]|jgi:phasin family protein